MSDLLGYPARLPQESDHEYALFCQWLDLPPGDIARGSDAAVAARLGVSLSYMRRLKAPGNKKWKRRRIDADWDANHHLPKAITAALDKAAQLKALDEQPPPAEEPDPPVVTGTIEPVPPPVADPPPVEENPGKGWSETYVNSAQMIAKASPAAAAVVIKFFSAVAKGNEPEPGARDAAYMALNNFFPAQIQAAAFAENDLVLDCHTPGGCSAARALNGYAVDHKLEPTEAPTAEHARSLRSLATRIDKFNNL